MAVLVMTPAEGLMLVPAKTPILGCPKLARLRILNASARNCKFNVSVMRILLNNEVSKSIRFGPRNWLRPHSHMFRPSGAGRPGG